MAFGRVPVKAPLARAPFGQRPSTRHRLACMELPMRRSPVLLAALLMLMPPAVARAAVRTAAHVPEDTMLTLSQTATVHVAPDELIATLRAEASAATAAEAQRQVNAAMADALAWAGHVPGVMASTGGYGVFRDTSSKPDVWHASQSFSLRASDGPPLLSLVGELQTKGLALNDLHWQLSDAAMQKAEADATREAIAALRARAVEAAGLLSLHFVRFATVRLDVPPPFRPVTRLMATAPGAAAPPPVATEDDIPVSATVAADVELAPK